MTGRLEIVAHVNTAVLLTAVLTNGAAVSNWLTRRQMRRSARFYQEPCVDFTDGL